MGKTIKLKGFKLSKNLEVQLYALEMPKEWMESFRAVFFDEKKNRKFLKTKELKDIIYSIHQDIVYVGDFFNYQQDSVWIISVSDICLDYIWTAFKGWQYALKKDEKLLVASRESFAEWVKQIKREDLGVFKEITISLTNEDGDIVDHRAYDIIPNLARQRVQREGLMLDGRNINFNIAESKRLISTPNVLWKEVKGGRKDYYSITIEFAIQTTPHLRKPILQYKTVITRWICKKVNHYVLKKKSVTVYAKVKEGVLYPIKLLTNKKGEFIWDNLSYEIIRTVNGSVEIPDAAVYTEVYPEYINQQYSKLAMSYNIGMGGRVTTVKAGLPMKDRDAIQQGLSQILVAIVEHTPMEMEQIIMRVGKIPDKISFDDTFRTHIAKAIDCDSLTIEIYSDGNESKVEAIKCVVEDHFGGVEHKSNDDLKIQVKYIDTRVNGILGSLEGKNELDKHEKRINLINTHVSKSDQVIGAIVVLPYIDDEGEECFKSSEDPKKAIRAGLATTGRLSQFLTPNQTENEKYRIEIALLDLYRQLGYVNYGKTNEKLTANYSMPISALHIINFKKTPYGHFNRIPVLITCDKNKGQVLAECPALWTGKILYREACLKFQELATREGQCKVKNMNTLIQIEKIVTMLYYVSKQPHLLLVKSDGVTRNVWKFLTDAEMSKTEKIGKYSLRKMWFDRERMNEGINFEGESSQLRIIRIRNNEEVPEYITNKKEEGYESSSGIYLHEHVYYGIASRPPEAPYQDTFREFSKIDNPQKEFKLPDMIEIYPIHLKETDNVKEWVTLTNNYRSGAHQFKWVLKDPLPLHLAKQLEEYIYG